MSINKKIYLSPPHLTGKELEYIEQALSSNWIAPLGPNVDRLEEEVSSYVGVSSAAAVSSGTAAIHLALRLLNVQKGDIVFCSTLTFVASSNPILYEGAEPVFIDSEWDTWNMSPQALEKALQEYKAKDRLPKAVIVVHLYGQCAKMDEILEICNNYSVPIIEDAAESLGSTFKDKKSGSIGRFGIFSFNGNKLITTSGGGILVSDDKIAINRARFLASQARDSAPYYQHSEIGYNYRMSNILAAIGLAQLEVIEERIQKRREIFERYKTLLDDIQGLDFMPELSNSFSNRWLTVLSCDPNAILVRPLELVRGLADENIEARLIWKPLHLQPLYKNCVFYQHGEGVPISEQLFRNGLCLPSGSSLEEDDQERIVKVVRKLISK